MKWDLIEEKTGIDCKTEDQEKRGGAWITKIL